MGRKTKIKAQRKELTVVLGQMEAQATLKARHQAASELNWIVDDVLKVADLNQDIRDLCRACSDFAAGYRGKELIEKLPGSVAGDLMSMLTQVALVFERLNADITPIRDLVMPYVNGIRALHNEGDEGEQLRAIDAGEGVNLLKQMRDKLKRREGVKQWRETLRHRWMVLEMENPTLKPAGIRQILIDQIAEPKPDVKPARERGAKSLTFDDYRMKPGTDDDDRQILNSLTGATATGTPAAFRRDLMKMHEG